MKANVLDLDWAVEARKEYLYIVVVMLLMLMVQFEAKAVVIQLYNSLAPSSYNQAVIFSSVVVQNNLHQTETERKVTIWK